MSEEWQNIITEDVEYMEIYSSKFNWTPSELNSMS